MDCRRVGHPLNHNAAMPSPKTAATTETASATRGYNGTGPYSTLTGTNTNEDATTARTLRVLVLSPWACK